MAGINSGLKPGYSRLKLSYPILHDNMTGMYKCTLCSYKSSHRSSVRSHYTVHSNARPYACDMCEYEAKRLTDLKKHKVLRHGKSLTALRLRNRRYYNGTFGKPSVSREDASHADYLNPEASVTAGEHYDVEDQMNGIDTMLDYHAQVDSSHNPTDNGFVDISAMNALSNAAFPVADLQPVDFDTDKLDDFSSIDQRSHKDAERVEVKSEPLEDYYGNTNHDKPDETSQRNDDKSNQDLQDDFQCMLGSTSEIGDRQSTDSENKDLARSSESEMTPSDCSVNQSSSSMANSGNLPQRKNVSGASLMNKAVTPPPSKITMAPTRPRSCGSTSDVSPIWNSSHFNLPINEPTTGLASRYSGLVQRTNSVATDSRKSWHCSHCDITYYDGAMYVMHMGLHNTENPWKCNLCGREFHDVYGFTSHFVNGHSAHRD